jgi:hypothetical protein
MTPEEKRALAFRHLASANRVRLKRSALKRDIAKGKVSVPEILRGEIPEWLEQMPVGVLVCSMQKMGEAKCGRLLKQVQLHPGSHLGYVTTRQRLALADLIEAWQEQLPSGRRARPRVNSVASVGRAA